MSWDVVLFNSKQKITSPAEVDEDQLAPTNFRAGFEEYFKDIKSDGNHRSVNGDGFTIEYFIDEDDEPSSNTLLNLYGEKAIYALIDLAKKQGWQIYDTGLDGMIDLDNPAKNGYHNFQKYLNQILNKE